jgi:hypothetical protein
MRRQFEMSPNAFATQQGLGQQAAIQFARLYGQSPMSAVPQEVQQNQGVAPVDYLKGIPRTGII